MKPTRRTWVRTGLAVAVAATSAEPTSHPTTLRMGGATLQLSFEGGPCDLASADLLVWIRTAAQAVTRYFGKFPVDEARVVVTIVENRKGVLHGTSWGYEGALTKIAIGQHTTVADLNNDWVMTHEFIHYGFPSSGVTIGSKKEAPFILNRLKAR